MVLAMLSQGEIIGIDQPALDKFTNKIKEMGLTDRIHAANSFLLDMNFPGGSFYAIWSEGSIYAIDFERGSLNGGGSSRVWSIRNLLDAILK